MNSPFLSRSTHLTPPPLLVQKWNESIQQGKRRRWDGEAQPLGMLPFAYSIVSHGASMGPMGPMGCLDKTWHFWFQPRVWLESGIKGKSQVGASKSASASCVKSPPLMLLFFLLGGISDVLQIFLLLKFWTWRKTLQLSNCLLTNMFFLCHWSLSLGVQARYESINLCLPRWVFDGLWMIDASFHAQHRIDHLEDSCSLICLLDIHTRSYIKNICSIGTPDNEYYIYWFIF